MQEMASRSILVGGKLFLNIDELARVVFDCRFPTGKSDRAVQLVRALQEQGGIPEKCNECEDTKRCTIPRGVT